MLNGSGKGGGDNGKFKSISLSDFSTEAREKISPALILWHEFENNEHKIMISHAFNVEIT